MTGVRIFERIFDPLSPYGAAKYGGRWNQAGTPAVYFSQTTSLSFLEKMAGDPYFLKSDRYKSFDLVTVEFPDDMIVEVTPLPKGWDKLPDSIIAQVHGTRLLKLNFCLKVPSVVVQTEYNYVFNPEHKDVNRVKIIAHQNLTIDSRRVP
jgi:RES domain-containing protein